MNESIQESLFRDYWLAGGSQEANLGECGKLVWNILLYETVYINLTKFGSHLCQVFGPFVICWSKSFDVPVNEHLIIARFLLDVEDKLPQILMKPESVELVCLIFGNLVLTQPRL